MVRIILHGCQGKMGQVISRLAKDDAAVKIVAGIDLKQENSCDYPVFTSLRECQVEADVVVDFSVAAAVSPLVEDCVAKKMPLVLCTTGLSKEQQNMVEQASQKIPLLQSANMSLGVNLLMRLVEEGAKALWGNGFDMEVLEKHHRNKVDAPSGTALALGEALKKGASDARIPFVMERASRRQSRPEREIGISSIRGGSIVGEHDVIFAGEDEVLTLTHTAYSKSIFGKGAIQAAKYLAKQTPGLYEMKDVLGL